MKVTIDEFCNALALLKVDVISTLPSLAHKAMLGFKFAQKSRGLRESILAEYGDKDGNVDVDFVKYCVDEMMDACKGGFDYPLCFEEYGLTHVDLKLKRADAERFFNDILPSVTAKRHQE